MAGFSMATRKSSSWAVARRRLLAGTKTFEGRVWLSVKRAALLAQREVKKGITSGAPGGQRFAPLSPFTVLLRRRRSRRPLRDDGDLRNSIRITNDKKSLSAFVGVHRNARGADGESLVNVALAHEFGTEPFVIQVTDAVRAFFFALSIRTGGAISPLSPNKTQIMHPGLKPRPFMRPTIEAIRPKLQASIRAEVARGGGPI